MARGGWAGERDEALPWLEPVEDEADRRRRRRRRGGGGTLLWVLVGVIALAAVVAGIGLFRGNDSADGTASLVKAPPEPYKVRPDDPGGMKIEGEGDSMYPAGAGRDPDATIDLGALPEQPLPREGVEAGDAAVMTAPASPPAASKAPATPPPAKPAEVAKPKAAATPPKPATPPTALASAALPGATPVAGGYALQLGAFSSPAKAEAAWKTLSGRFTFLGGLTKSVSPVGAGDKTLYRLRAGGLAKASADNLCARMKVSGDACSVVGP